VKYRVFLSQFARHPLELGTFTQSSRVLARRMAREIDGAHRVVELGAGLGPVTREILRRLPDNGQLICIERNGAFCRALRQLDDPRLQVIHDDALQSEPYVAGANCVISGLPLTLFDEDKRRRLLDIMSKAPKCVQLQYTPRIALEMRTYFSNVKLKIVPWNIPPALLYVATQAQPTPIRQVPRRTCRSPLLLSRKNG